ncbi:hypothetical protein AK812_SmicGene46118, partial [Symbiodinium microadriaticum]
MPATVRRPRDRSYCSAQGLSPGDGGTSKVKG